MNIEKILKNYTASPSIQSMRRNRIKSKKEILKYANNTKYIVFVEIILDCDGESSEDSGKDFLWAILEFCNESTIWVRFIQYSQSISYIKENELYEFDFDDITNWSIKLD